MTATLKRLSYARICIEICIDDSLPSILELEQEDGSIVEIRIEYNWVPKKCSICRAFGHLPKNCKKGSHQSWIPKSSAVEAPLPKINSSSAVEAPLPKIYSGSVIGSGKSPVSKDLRYRSSSLQASSSYAPSNPSAVGDAPSLLINPGVAVLKVPDLSSPVSAIASASLPVSNEAWIPGIAEDPIAEVDDPIAPAVDPIGSGAGSHFDVDDPHGITMGIPLASDGPFGSIAGDPIGTVAGDPNFDDPNVFCVPMAISSASPVVVSFPSADPSPSDQTLGCVVPHFIADPASDNLLALVSDHSVDQSLDQSAPPSRVSPSYVLSSPSSGGAVPSPILSPSFSSRLSRKLIMVDEVDKILGRQKKGKKKCGGSGNSRRMSPKASK